MQHIFGFYQQKYDIKQAEGTVETTIQNMSSKDMCPHEAQSLECHKKRVFPIRKIAELTKLLKKGMSWLLKSNAS